MEFKKKAFLLKYLVLALLMKWNEIILHVRGFDTLWAAYVKERYRL